jgi:pantoate--beta-alanine ligase
MKVIYKVEELLQIVREQKARGASVGLVPTMGALHRGHVSLFKNAVKETDFVIGTIFINRIQFNNPSDFEKYPRTVEKDLNILKETGAHVIFVPEEEEIYKDMVSPEVSLGELAEIMEGKYRPGHFEGVLKIVNQFFKIIKPTVAFFGQKDLQQFKVIEKLVKDQNLPVALKMCPIIREDDGLAMSSRNVRISEAVRPVAAKIYAALNYGGDLLQFGDSVEQTRKKVAEFIDKFKPLKLEYFEICDAETLSPVKVVQPGRSLALCISVFMEEVRLIDNIIIIS